MRSVSALPQRGHATGVACHSRRGLDTACTGGAMPKLPQLDPPGGAQPVAAPGRRQHLLDLGIGIAVPVEGAAHGGADHLGGRTARVRRRESDPQPAVAAAAHVAHDAQVHHAQHRDLRDRVPRRAAPGHARLPRRRRRPGCPSPRSPAQPGIGALQVLHLGEQVAEVLGVHAALAVPGIGWPRPDGAAWRPARSASTCADQGAARPASAGAMPAACMRSIDLVGGEELRGEAPQLLERTLQRARGSRRCRPRGAPASRC